MMKYNAYQKPIVDIKEDQIDGFNLSRKNNLTEITEYSNKRSFSHVIRSKWSDLIYQKQVFFDYYKEKKSLDE
jgi:hypothetical protein